jgi:hypothetical protein
MVDENLGAAIYCRTTFISWLGTSTVHHFLYSGKQFFGSLGKCILDNKLLNLINIKKYNKATNLEIFWSSLIIDPIFHINCCVRIFALLYHCVHFIFPLVAFKHRSAHPIIVVIQSLISWYSLTNGFSPLKTFVVNSNLYRYD